MVELLIEKLYRWTLMVEIYVFPRKWTRLCLINCDAEKNAVFFMWFCVYIFVALLAEWKTIANIYTLCKILSMCMMLIRRWSFDSDRFFFIFNLNWFFSTAWKFTYEMYLSNTKKNGHLTFYIFIGTTHCFFFCCYCSNIVSNKQLGRSAFKIIIYAIYDYWFKFNSFWLFLVLVCVCVSLFVVFFSLVLLCFVSCLFTNWYRSHRIYYVHGIVIAFIICV